MKIDPLNRYSHRGRLFYGPNWFVWLAVKWSCFAVGVEVVNVGILIYLGPVVVGVGNPQWE